MSDNSDCESGNYLLATLLQRGDVIDYTVPSFPVFTVKLREIKMQYEETNGSPVLMDAFAKECDDLSSHLLPAVARIPYSTSHAFQIDVSSYNDLD